MKTRYILSILCAAFLLQSCYKPGKIQIQNNINSVEIYDVQWGDIDVSGSLFPGETSGKLKVYKSEAELPESHIVSFKMTANQKTVFLKTVEKYKLEQDEELLIILDDATAVENPNN